MNGRRIALLGMAWVAGAACSTVNAWAESAKGGNHFGLPIAPRDYSAQFFLDVDAAGNLDSESRSILQGPTEAQFTAADSETVTEAADGVSSSATTDYSTTFSLDLGTSVFSGSYTAEGSATVDNSTGSPQRYSSEYTVDFELQFGVECGSATIQIMGSGSASEAGGAANAIASVQLDGDTEFEFLIMPSGGTESRPINESLQVGPGSYFLRFLLEGGVFSSESNAASVTSESELDINVTITPGGDCDAPEVFWSINDGAYNVAENWEPQQVPGMSQTAIFDRNASYTVAIGDEETGRAEIERGIVAFTGNTYTLSGGDEDTGSLIAGASSEDIASLELRLAQLNTLHSIIGDLGVTNASVLSILSTVWANQGRMWVGRDGIGSLTLGNDARLTTGELRVGDGPGSQGSMLIFGSRNGTSKQATLMTLVAGTTGIGLEGMGSVSVTDAFLTTGETQLGVFEGSTGSITIEESPNITFWDLTGDLFVGNLGTATVDIGPGGVLRSKLDQTTDMIVANSEGSTGCVSVNGLLATLAANGNLIVGPGGMGRVLASNGGRVAANNLYVGPSDATNETARGDIILTGSGEPDETAQLAIAGELVVGQAGIGVLIAVDESLITSQSGNIGGGPAGSGFVDLTMSTWRIERGLGIGTIEFDGESVLGSGDLTLIDADIETGTLVFLFDGSRINGMGSITAPMSALSGTVSPGVTVSSRKQSESTTMCSDSEEPKQNGPENPIGTLAFNGDVMFDGATITIEVSGDGKTQFDAINVTGTADLQGASVQFVFIDGYLPRTGDELSFLTAANITMDAATTFTYTGAAPGFEFDVMNMGNALMFQAQSDAEAEGGGEGEGEGEGDGEGMGDGGGCASGGDSDSGDGSAGLSLIALVVILFARRVRTIR